MGSRYGGLKQLDEVGPSGETVMDYSVFDAMRAGFDRVVFVIRKDIEEDFRRIIGDRISEIADVSYAFQDLSALPDKATVLVPNDVTNEARALLLLEAQGLIKLEEGAGLEATPNEIVENPKDLDIVELEAAQLPRSLADCDIAVINGNYAIEAGLKVSDALATESSDSLAASTYGNVVAVREGEENSDAIKALIEAYADWLTGK